MSERPEIIIYTDGSCSPNPGRGGWAAILFNETHKREVCGGELHTTNNRMELIAVVEALKRIKQPSKIVLHSDSKYVIEGVSSWLEGWKAKGFKKVKNPELWMQLDELIQPHSINWVWVKGHEGVSMNERADALANEGRLRQKVTSTLLLLTKAD
ncbi:ribonuclease HI [Rhodobacteraceae bacterium RKSG542]|uniref:ribonuclease HI n=1 Tax=Pseudovibrio flavus TaxID=2529854 RepID=UPI0012BBA3B7|nr:ribonuclease HI [Pseudovibrio flavus]MTI16827.1 ribonuclease HI [Pseudovibrio flavus]